MDAADVIRWMLALSISGLGLWVAFRGTDWGAMAQVIRGVKSPGWLLLPLFYPPLEFLARSIRWRMLFMPLRRTSLKTFFPVITASFFLNNVLPFRAGEAARVYWSAQKTGVSVGSALAVLVADRVFDMMCLLSIVVLILYNKSHLFHTPKTIIFFAAATLGGLAVLLVMARFPGLLARWIEKPWIPEKAKVWSRQFLDGAQALKSGGVLLGAYGLSLAFWAANITIIQRVAGAFSVSLTWIDSAWLVTAFCFGALLPSTPGYVGTLEAAGVAALGLLGVDKNVALPLVLVIHFIQILSTALWGIPCLMISGLNRRQPL